MFFIAVPDRPAAAQDALGAGDALDANLSPQFGRRNTPIQQPDFRARNRIVTGDVAGGRGFRGAVGYGAEADFRGAIGADDLFGFRSGAALSSPEVFRTPMGREPFRIGQEFGMIEYQRDFSGATARDVRSGVMPDTDRFVGDHFRPRDDFQVELDRMTTSLATGRMAEREIQPYAVSTMRTAEGEPYVITASPLRGLRAASIDEARITDAMSSFDYMRLRQDIAHQRIDRQIGAAFEPGFSRWIDEPDPRTPDRDRDDRGDREVRADDRVRATPDSDYARILQRIADRYADSPNVRLSVDATMIGALDEEFDDLRQTLRQLRDRGTPTRDDRATMPLETDEEIDALERDAPETGGIGLPDDFARETTRRERGPDEDGPIGAEPGFSTLLPALRHGQRIDRLSPDEEDRFAELFRQAEEQLEAQSYFLAEQTFNRSLRIVRDHPVARAGLGHAQLGGRLYRSASVTLQRLLIDQPEMIDVRYGANLLPPQEHLDEMISELRLRQEQPRDKASASFLIAYLGHQFEDREMVESGMASLAEARPDDPLVPLLRAIWLDDDDALGDLDDTLRDHVEESLEQGAEIDLPADK
ncbi:MAG: hypothetical protein EA377_04540 [Phycisphaerales bacterium]|nr:MAG: hypothetical protein EA377_04540 [Phycisphaerales bacterium]